MESRLYMQSPCRRLEKHCFNNLYTVSCSLTPLTEWHWTWSLAKNSPISECVKMRTNTLKHHNISKPIKGLLWIFAYPSKDSYSTYKVRPNPKEWPYTLKFGHIFFDFWNYWCVKNIHQTLTFLTNSHNYGFETLNTHTRTNYLHPQ